jgi:hypothetical protein
MSTLVMILIDGVRVEVGAEVGSQWGGLLKHGHPCCASTYAGTDKAETSISRTELLHTQTSTNGTLRAMEYPSPACSFKPIYWTRTKRARDGAIELALPAGTLTVA